MATVIDRISRHVLRLLGVRARLVESSVAQHHVYDTGGSGTTIVCLPGLADSGASWAPVMLALRRRGFRVVLVEGAGHGLSSEARATYTIEAHFASVAEVLGAVVDQPAVLVGNSLGGAAALRYAVAQASRVRAVFLTSPGGGTLTAEALADVRAAFTMRSTADARAFMQRILHRTTRLHLATARLMLAHTSSAAVRDLVADLHIDHMLEGLDSIRVPIQLIWGRSERLLPPSCLASLEQQLPAHAVITQPEGFGHCPHLDDPFRLARMIEAFATA